MLEGLIPPKPVVRALEQWKARSDVVAHFIADNLRGQTKGQVRASEMYSLFEAWCRSNGENPESVKRFTHSMVSHGQVHKRLREGSFWMGVELFR